MVACNSPKVLVSVRIGVPLQLIYFDYVLDIFIVNYTYGSRVLCRLQGGEAS